MRRETFLTNFIAGLSLAVTPAIALARDDASMDLSKLERETGGRLGVVAVDTGTGETLSYRANERFPMCSTFKFLAAAAVLARVDRGDERLDRHVAYTNADLLDYAPVTRKHVTDGFMTVQALCEAAIEYSDNTAANLLLSALGGPHGVTEYARTLRDRVTTLNRTEPTLNTAIPGDVRDTTTPAAIADDMQSVLLGNALSAASRSALTEWLVKCRTGDKCLRAGLPSSWTVGDKTGMGGATNAVGDSDTRNDIAIAWPGKGAPLIIAAYLTRSKLSASDRDAALAAVSRIVTAHR